MEINGLMVRMIDALLDNSGCMSADGLAAAVEISKRSVRYHIEKINDCLAEAGLQPIVLRRGHLFLDMSATDRIEKLLVEAKKHTYVLSKQERKAVVCIAAATGSSMTIDQFSAYFGVSRNTTISEIRELKTELAEQQIDLSSAGKVGYRIRGEETSIRYYLVKTILDLPVPEIQQRILGFVQEAAERLFGCRINEAFIREMMATIVAGETELGVKYNNNAIREMVDYLLLVAVRSQQGFLARKIKEIEELREFASADSIIRRMEEFGITIPVQEQSYIAAILLGSRLYDIDRASVPDSADMESFTTDLIDVFSARTCIRFDKREELVAQLLLHIRPMFYRLRYHIKVKNVLTREIQSRYHEMYNMTDLAVKTIERDYGLSVPEDEVAYLCAYLSGWAQNYLPVESDSKDSTILVVCGAGISTSLLIKKQLSALLGDSYSFCIKDFREVTQYGCADYLLVVSTVELPFMGDNIVWVKPILSRSQQQEIILRTSKNNFADPHGVVADLLDAIESYAVIENREALGVQLLKTLSAHQKEKTMDAPQLLQVLTSNMIQIIEHAETYETALDMACQPLIQRGIVTESYPWSIAEIVDRLGLYSEIAPYIMLAHGSRDEQVTQVGVALSVFRKPVLFPKWDKEIRVMFVLAAPDNESHLPLLDDIMKLIGNGACRRQLTDGNFADANQILCLIESVLA